MKKYLLAAIILILSGIGLLAQPTLVEIQTTDVSCNGGSDGTVTIVITGGQPPYNYTIFKASNYQVSPSIADTFYTFSSVTAENWNIIVEDSNNDGFSEFLAADVQEPDPISINGINVTPISCTGFADAEIQVSATGESGNYNYELNPGGILNSTGIFSPLGPGTYTVTVTDATGCSTSDTSDPIAINDPDPISVVSESSTDATCFGADNGTASATAAGGTPQYTYTLNPGALQTNNTGDFSGLAPGTYSIEITDINNCAPASTGALAINEPPELIITGASSTDISCTGAGDGTISITVNGGTPGYEYTLSPGNIVNTTGNFTGLSQGDYTVSVTDANSCGPVSTGTLTINEPAPIGINNVSSQDVSCNGAADGQISVTASGGTAPLSYTLDPGAITNGTGDFPGLNGGSYTVTVNDANGCPAAVTGAIDITDPAPITITGQSKTDITCNGANDGTITVTATGGTGTLTYTLDPGAISNTTGSFTNLGPDTYTVSVDDENNCPTATTTPITINEPDAISIDDENVTDISCTGADDGTVSVSVSGGTPPYSYTLQPAGTVNSTGSFSGLSAGTYTIEVTDASSCGPVSSGTLTVNEPAPISISDINSQDISCNGAGDGEIHITAAGGTAPLTYTLDPVAITNGTGDFTGLDGGSYTVTVNDVNGCPSATTGNIDIIDPDPIVITDQNKTDITCNGANDGTITVTASGGTGTLTYTLNPGAISNTTGIFTNLGPDTYSVSVDDVNNCPSASTTPITINEPTAITIDDESSTDISCAGFDDGIVSVSVSGGTPPYSYTLQPSGTVNSTGNFSGLSAGNYTIEVSDASSCGPISSGTLTVNEPAPISISNFSSQDISCNGAGDGQISVTAAGGTAPLSYTLNPGGVTQPTGDFNNLAGGTFTVTVDDANACPSADTGPIEIIDPTPVTITDQTKTDISCNGAGDGTITITASGGTGTLTYTLNPGAVSNTTGSFSGLEADSYTVSVEDENGCSTATATPIDIIEPAPIGATVEGSSQLSLNCAGDSDGSIDINVTGGTAPLSFEWTGPSGFSASDKDISGLSAGTYTLNITDANSCILNTPLEVDITEPPLLTVSLTKTDVTCAGDANGTITVNASGGTPGYEYSRNGITYQTGDQFTGLTENDYTIFVRDANGCISTENISIDEPDELIVASEIRIDNNQCYGDSLGEIRILDVTGGTEPYEYSINNGIDFSSDAIFQNLPAGSYQTVVRDSNGCIADGNLNKINQPSQIKISDYAQVDVTDCYGNINGQIFIEATGGTGSKEYTLDGTTTNSTGLFDPVDGGTHNITITDENTCIKDTTVELSEPDPILFTSISITDVTGCTGDANAAVDFSASGGAGGIQYAIDGGPFGGSGTFTDLSAGNHTLSVLDANACPVDSVISITEPQPLAIDSENSTDISCPGANDGSITITASGGTMPYTYTLVPGGTEVNDGIFNGLSAGTYTVEIDDVNNCGPITSSEFTINEPAPIAVDSVTTQEILCNGDDNAEIHIYLSGGTPPYEYSIDDGANFSASGDFVGLAPGTYFLEVRDVNACSMAVDTLEFTEPPALNTDNESKTDVNTCFGDASGEITFAVSGGTPPIQYSIDGGLSWQDNGNYSNLTAGDYTVIAEDANGCQISSGTLSITQPDEITADITTTPARNETQLGSITISNASGGTGSLEYSISGLAGPFSTETEYTDLEAGTYEVVIRDANGCTYEESVEVTQIQPLDVTVSVTHNTCYGSDDASITMVANDPVGQAEYSIDDSASWSGNGVWENISAGTYYVFARDEDNRYFQDTIVINEPVEMTIFSNITPASCNSFSNDGAIDITVNGATGNVDYQWSTGSTSEDLNNITAGIYWINTIDENGCSASDTIEVPALTRVIADAGEDTAVCYGDELRLNGQGGTTLAWSPAEGLSDTTIANPLVETTEDRTFILRASGMNDCYDTDTINITVYPRLGLDAGPDTSLTEDQSFTISTEGGPYLNYNWEPASGIDDTASANPTVSPSQTTTYVVNAETEDGCIDRDTITISIADRLVIYNAFSPNGDGINDYWDIDYADLYPEITVEVFNRWGKRLFSSKGYTDDKRWDGRFNGTDVPVGTYYYVVVPYPGASAITGPLTIVR